jgi:hypothetical protein
MLAVLCLTGYRGEKHREKQDPRAPTTCASVVLRLQWVFRDAAILVIITDMPGPGLNIDRHFPLQSRDGACGICTLPY